MLPLRTIRDPRAASRPQRAKRALELLPELISRLSVEPNTCWNGWERVYEQMIAGLTPETLMNFKADPNLGPQICGGDDSYLTRLRDQFGAEALRFFLATFRETWAGNPRDITSVEGCYLSRTSMRHLYYLAVIHRFARSYFGRPVEFVEIGGGFGNLARLTSQYGLSHRHTILDMPPSLCIQYYFLGEFFDEKDIAVWTGTQYLCGSEASAVRLALPNAADVLAANLAEPSFLVSTMALTEIPKSGQDYYLDRVKPNAIFISGQTMLDALNRAQPLLEISVLENRDLFLRLANEFHMVEYRSGDYYTEFLGLKA